MNVVTTGDTGNPFSRRAVIGVVLTGGLLFAALLWMIGTGTGFQSANDGQAHAAGQGLNGYAAMVEYLGRRGYDIGKARNAADLNPQGLLVLSPPPDADGKEIDRIVSAHRYDGATLVLLPKWSVSPATQAQVDKGAKRGWVNLVSARPPEWKGFLDDVAAGVARSGSRDGGRRVGWSGLGLSGYLPGKDAAKGVVAWGKGDRLVPLVRDDEGRILAAFVDDGGTYPDLEDAAQVAREGPVRDKDLYPLVLVFEPDLLDNYAMADRHAAQLLDALIPRLEVEKGDPVVFDLTLNGFGRARNLLTLAVTPPFLGVTLCLLLAAALVGWRAFVRFGPSAAPERAIAFGKQALVANSAGLITRSRRFHLLRGPYADRARERLVKALALPRGLDVAAAEAAIDRALAARAGAREPFSTVSARLRGAATPHAILKAARDLHALERTLKR
ncbi:DUF4350 domain-containing protein [Novosphingobium profundi]|uniref:DUF4350 domain-containing protein n=1 Tax=Novosphingobium profundi TaxID=1774954 RepID=UPI001BD9B5CF|nr:DUF4350 domain-containing protein [Novosphingobium profundi]MBT0667661.1 DUF4350 domain-containing protein [Novosphingobium profundi]